MSHEKFFKITAVVDEYDEYPSVQDIKFEEVGLNDILAKMSDYDLQNLGLVRVQNKDPKKKEEGLSQTAVMSLKYHGWVHLDTVKDRAERKKYTQKFYYVDPVYKHAQEIDVDRIGDNDHLVGKLASGAVLMQEVEPESVLSEKAQKKLETKKKALKKNAAERAEKVKAAAEAKKKKAVEKAKKLLKEAGELS